MPTSTNGQIPSVPLYADGEHEGSPICLDCFLRRRNDLPEPDEEWNKLQEKIHTLWERTPDEIRQQQDIEDPDGWVKLLLNFLKWPRVQGRSWCWVCSQRLALGYRALVEELQGAQAVAEFCARCQAAAAEANTLALEIAASGHKPIVPIFESDPKYGHLPDLVTAHVASIRVLLAEPEPLSVKALWALLHSRIVKALGNAVLPDNSEQIKYEPLKLGAEKVWEIAVILKQAAGTGSVARHNFAGVVQEHAKDPYNPPKRLALVKAHEWSQQMVPPMTYVELASLLVEHGVADASGGEVIKLADNIKIAVNKYRALMPIAPARY